MQNRKAFNFYRSYYEVALELPKKDRLDFLMALIKIQFTGQESELKGMAKFAFMSQKHSINKQIEGFKSGVNGGRPSKGNDNPPIKGSNNHPLKGNSNQVQEQDKVQVQDKGKDVDNRKEDFKKILRPFIGDYEKKDIIDFFEYWSEHGIKDRKMRFEKEKSFSVDRRLKTWINNKQKWEKEKSSAKKEKVSHFEKIMGKEVAEKARQAREQNNNLKIEQ